jgi:catechol 2,3-dioxygenase-like lactoylglutathione lyase family enzyme
MPEVQSSLTHHGEPTALKTYGIHHAAYPCWDPAGTLRLYRDVLGFSMPHAIPAWGWGPDNNPDMVHFFFDIGNGDTLAFFYYFGWERPAALPKPLQQATHPAIEVADEDTLLEIEAKLTSAGYETFKVAHETIESIYHWDCNGLLLEFTRHLRPFDAADVSDAQETMDALATALSDGATEISDVWRAKADTRGLVGGAAVHILDVPEWSSAIDWARQQPDLTVTQSGGCQIVSSSDAVEFARRTLGLRPAVWYTLPAGGLEGTITQFDREVLRVEP